MAVKEPQVRADIQLCHYLAFAEFAAGLADVHNAVEHQHVGFWQLCVAWAEQFAVATEEQVFAAVRAFGFKGSHGIYSASDHCAQAVPAQKCAILTATAALSSLVDASRGVGAGQKLRASENSANCFIAWV